MGAIAGLAHDSGAIIVDAGLTVDSLKLAKLTMAVKDAPGRKPQHALCNVIRPRSVAGRAWISVLTDITNRVSRTLSSVRDGLRADLHSEALPGVVRFGDATWRRCCARGAAPALGDHDRRSPQGERRAGGPGGAAKLR